jgi:hypothetical protein
VIERCAETSQVNGIILLHHLGHIGRPGDHQIGHEAVDGAIDPSAIKKREAAGEIHFHGFDADLGQLFHQRRIVGKHGALIDARAPQDAGQAHKLALDASGS